MAVFNRVVSAWNAFFSGNDNTSVNRGPSSSTRPHVERLRYSNERSILASVLTRIAMDAAGIDLRHVKLDDQDRYASNIKDPLSLCLSYEANMDQAPRAFKQDIYTTMFDNGVSVVVPVDTTRDQTGEIVDIYSVRVGIVQEWLPAHVRVSVYNEKKGLREDITVEKRLVAIIENPLFAIMNLPNSTLQRLIRKLNLLDFVDEQSGSGKLDLIIQLPYVIKSEARRQQAEQRREDIEFQLKGSKYGIAYTDGTEKVTQLNRPAENNLLAQVEYLRKELYSQLGITEEVMNGTADEKVMINYFNRTIAPLLDAVVEAMQRSFLGMTKTLDNERIMYFRNPFMFVPVNDLANIADKFSRNEILSPNEIRGFMGIVPSTDPKADKLINSNMPPDNTSNQD